MIDYIKLTLKIGLYLFIFIASMYAFMMIGIILGTIIFGIDVTLPELMPISIFMGSIGTLFSIFIFWLMLKNKEKDLISLCNFDKISSKNALLIISITIGFSAFAIIYLILVNKYNLIPDMKIYIEMMQGMMETVPGIISILIAAIIVAPITEEILFRGIIFNFLREKISLTSSIVIQAILFGAIHLNIFQGIFAFVGGILLAYVYIWTKSIWSVIIIHALNNLLAIIHIMLLVEMIEIPDIVVYVYITIGVVTFIPSLWLLYKDNIKKSITEIEPF